MSKWADYGIQQYALTAHIHILTVSEHTLTMATQLGQPPNMPAQISSLPSKRARHLSQSSRAAMEGGIRDNLSTLLK